MKSSARAIWVLTFVVLFHNTAQVFKAQRSEDHSTRAEAERMWQLMLEAKGGRERLHAVKSVQLSSHEKYLLWFEILTINYEGVFVFPNKSWEWDDQRGSVFGFSIHVHNFENNVHRSYVDKGNGASVVPIHEPSTRNLTQWQLHLFSETKWEQPIPESFRRGKVGERDVDIVQTRFTGFPAEEQKVEFALDKKTHLPVKVTYFWTRNNRELSGGVELKDYVEVDGIKMPSRVGSVRSKYKLNTEYDEGIFERAPSREAGMDAWKKNP